MSITKLKSYPAKSGQCKIDVFHHSRPDKPFEDIALLRPGLNPSYMPDFKKSACLVGGDAIILEQEKGIFATVIKYKK